MRSPYWPNSTSTISFDSNSTTNSSYLFRSLHVLGDLQSVQDIMDVLVTSSCNVVNSTVSSYNASVPLSSDGALRPEEVVQYYRSSSFALTLDGYNNTSAWPSNAPVPIPSSDKNTSAGGDVADTALPTDGLDLTFLDCVNTSIGEALPIMNRADRGASMESVPLMGLIWLLVLLTRAIPCHL